MGLSLGRCSSVDEFELFLDSLPKPIEVRANYVVIDANGGASVFEVSSYTFTRFDTDSTAEGFLVRANLSFSQDMTNIDSLYPSSVSRHTIATNYLNEALQIDGYITKENFFELSRCLVNSDSDDLRDVAPFSEEPPVPMSFSRLIPTYSSTSSMIVQGILPDEIPDLTTAWTMVGPPLSTVIIPFWMTSDRTFPTKSVIGSDGYSWLSHQGQLLKSSMFINSTTVNLAKLYNLSSTGIMQKIGRIEEDILLLGEELLDKMRGNGFSDDDVATYYAWVDNYLEDQYSQFFYNGAPTNAINGAVDETREQETEYYDLLDRRVRNAPDNAVIKRTGNKAIILN